MHATLHTTLGDITISLFDDKAPQNVAAFVDLVRGAKQYTLSDRTTEGPFYDGCRFHYVVDGFFIQGGDPTFTCMGGADVGYVPEFHPELTFDDPFRVATVASTSRPSCQFVITLRPMPHLNGSQFVFGEVADPLAQKVVRDIAAIPTDSMGAPVEPVTIESVTVD